LPTGSKKKEINRNLIIIKAIALRIANLLY